MAKDKSYVTLATDDNYGVGAMILGNSLRRVGTKHKLTALISSGVSEFVRSKLENVFDEVQEVDILQSNDTVNLSLMRRPELGATFTKLHIWRLEHYSKCVFLDADTLVLKNCDELFEKDELSAVPDVGWPDCFNSGVFVFVPSLTTYNELIKLANEEGSFDGGDQGLLNAYFSGWRTKDIANHLSFIYNMVTSSSYSYAPAYKHFGQNVKIVHFLGNLKPWFHGHFDSQSNFQPCESCAHAVESLLLWWEIYKQNFQDLFSQQEVTLPEDLHKSFVFNVAASEDQRHVSIIETDTFSQASRQHSWEKGQIDYLGEDAFDSIKRRLDEVINEKK